MEGTTGQGGAGGGATGDVVATAKAALRAAARARRATAAQVGAVVGGLTPLDLAIAARLRALLDELVGADAVVGLYAALPGEVDLDGLLVDLVADGRAVALPRSAPDRSMAFALVSAPPVATGLHGVREPDADAPVVEPSVVVVPGLAMDRDGGRLGYGAGYYDRWLGGHPGVRAVGVCPESALIPAVPRDAHDVRLDAVVTEAAVYR